MANPVVKKTPFSLMGHRVTLTTAFAYEDEEGLKELPAGLVLAEGMGPPPLLSGTFLSRRDPGVVRQGWLFTTQTDHPVIPRESLLVEELTFDVVGTKVVEDSDLWEFSRSRIPLTEQELETRTFWERVRPG